MQPPRLLRCASAMAAALVLLALASLAPPAAAARPRPSPPGAQQAPDAAAEEEGDAAGAAAAAPGASPRAAMTAFLVAAREGNYLRAAQSLDFSAAGGWPGDEAAAETARAVHLVLDRLVGRIDLAALSDAAEGDGGDGDAARDVVARVATERGPLVVGLVRNELGTWLLGPEVVRAAPDLLADTSPRWVEALPDPFFEVRFLEIDLWQWLALLALVPIAAALALVVSSLVLRALRSGVRRTHTDWDDSLVGALSGPLRLGIGVGLYALGSLFLALPLVALDWIGVLAKVLVVLAVAWLLLRIVDVAATIFQTRLAQRDAAAAGTLVPLARRVTKVFVVAVAVVSLIHNLGFNVAGILAGLGVGGLAVALAAQKTLENLFGGFSVIADRPVRVGEFCKVGDHVGTVEDIGLRSTRIRTLDRTLVTIPNSEFSTVRIENFAPRDRMKLAAVLQFGYDTTPDQLRYLIVEIRRLLYAHPLVATDPCRVKLVAFGAYSLDVEVFAYVETADWGQFLDVREDLFLRVMDIAKESGASFAFPSQTLYMARHEGADPERARAAERRVEELRAAGRLPLPGFTSEQLAEVRGTLPWPPEGSALAAPRA